MFTREVQKSSLEHFAMRNFISLNIVRIVKSRRRQWGEHVPGMKRQEMET